jgi:hypothetical protein
VLVVTMVVWSALACSTSASSSGSAQRLEPSPAVTAATPGIPPVQRRQGCFGSAPPPSWAAAFRANTVNVSGVADVDVLAVAQGQAVVQAYGRPPHTLWMVDLASGRSTRVATLDMTAAGTGAGASWLSFDPPWVVWTQGDSPYNGSDFSVHAWNQTTGATSLLFTSRLGNGAFTYGFMPFPVVHHGYGYWAQPLPRTSQAPQAELRRVELSTGRSSVLDTGSISSAVVAGTALVWGRSEAGGQYSFRALNVDTLQPVTLPAQLTSGYRSTIGYLAASPEYLAWSGSGVGNQELSAWKVDTNQLSGSTFDQNHLVQFMQAAGHILLWYTGTRSVVFDLETGKGFDVRGALAGSSDAIAWSSGGAQLQWMRTASAPPIVECPPQ